MNKILQQIIKNTTYEIAQRKINSPLDTPEVSRQKSFGNFLEAVSKKDRVSIIAEIKFASPTEKNLGSEKELIKIAKLYQKSRADAISIITEKSVFKGDRSFVTRVKSAVKLPVLQKDFVINPYQIYEAKFIGSDALLLIAKIISKNKLIEFVNICQNLGIEPVVEINDDADLEKALATSTKIIAVNARNLSDLKVDVDQACKLMKKIPQKYTKLGFSGIHSKVEVEKYKSSGANAILVGTSLMKSKNPIKFLEELR